MSASWQLRVASYVRDTSATTNKFSSLDRLIRDVKDKRIADAILVESPKMLGDDYEELVTNLHKLGDAEISLFVMPRSGLRRWQKP